MYEDELCVALRRVYEDQLCVTEPERADKVDQVWLGLIASGLN